MPRFIAACPSALGSPPLVVRLEAMPARAFQAIEPCQILETTALLTKPEGNAVHGDSGRRGVGLADLILPMVLGCGEGMSTKRGVRDDGNPSADKSRHIHSKGSLQPEIEHRFSSLREPELSDVVAATVEGFTAVLECFNVLLPTAFAGPGSQWLVSNGTSDSTDGKNVFRNGSNIPKVGGSPIVLGFAKKFLEATGSE